MLSRPRRNRKNEIIRHFVAENELTPDRFIFPLFVCDGRNKKIPIPSLPDLYCYSSDGILKEIERSLKSGIRAFCLFPRVEEKLKDKTGSFALKKNNFYLSCIKKIREVFPDVVIMTDVALDPYSSDGHDGIVKNGKIHNDETLPVLANMAVLQAEAGADIIGPSDMMDGRVRIIREALDKNGFSEVSIMSYTAKYASAFYGPFRDALNSSPKFGDKKTYQMNPANIKEALREAALDEQEGADFLMVKPALSYLDVIHSISQHTTLPVAAYNVSGEYAMIKAAGKQGWIDEKKVRDEVLLSIRRAGASVILSYFAREWAEDYCKNHGISFP
jgi:porphobilinogen synthase